MQHALELVMVLPGKVATKTRKKFVNIIERYMTGDPSLIDEIQANAMSSTQVVLRIPGIEFVVQNMPGQKTNREKFLQLIEEWKQQESILGKRLASDLTACKQARIVEQSQLVTQPLTRNFELIINERSANQLMAIGSVKDDVKSVGDDVKSLSENVKSLEKQLEYKDSQYKELEKQLEFKDSQYKELEKTQNEHIESTKKKNNSLQEQVQTLLAQNKTLKEDLHKSTDSHKTQMKAKDDTIANNKKELAAQRIKIADQKETIQNMNRNPIEKRHLSLEAKVDTNTASTKSLKAHIVKLEAMTKIIIAAVAPQSATAIEPQEATAVEPQGATTVASQAFTPTTSQAPTAVAPQAVKQTTSQAPTAVEPTAVKPTTTTASQASKTTTKPSGWKFLPIATE